MKRNHKRHNRWETSLPKSPVLYGIGTLFDFQGSYYRSVAVKIQDRSIDEELQSDWLAIQEDFREVQKEYLDELSEKK